MEGLDLSKLADLTRGERISAACAFGLLLAMLVLPWFTLSSGGVTTPGTSGNAFRWLGSVDTILVLIAAAVLALPVLGALRVVEVPQTAAGIAVLVLGVAAFVLIVDRVISPPGLQGDAFGHFGGAADSGASTRIGAWAGLLLAAGIAAGGLLSLTATGGPVTRSPRNPPQTTPVPAEPVQPAKATRAFTALTGKDLEAMGLSAAEARRVLRFRDDRGLIERPEDLHLVPGIPEAKLERLQRRLGGGWRR